MAQLAALSLEDKPNVSEAFRLLEERKKAANDLVSQKAYAEAADGFRSVVQDGRQQLGRFDDGERQDGLSERFLYWEYPRRRLWQAGRSGKWKAVRYGMDGATELYDLEADPQESEDVSSRNTELVQEFEKWFNAEHIPSPHWPVH